MMGLKIVPFKPEHLEGLKRLLDDRALEMLEGSGMGEAVKGCLFNEHSFCALCDGRVIGAAGITPFFGAVGMAWAFITPELRRYPLFLFRSIKRYLDEVMVYEGFERIETLVLEGFDAGIRFAERLGFSRDGGGMQGFGPRGESFIKYVRVFRCVGSPAQEIS